MNRRRLYRSTHDRRLAGVAGGLADYLDLDPTLVRILWAVSIFFGGFTILLYIAMALIVPEEPSWSPGYGPGYGGPAGYGPTGYGPAGRAWGAPPATAGDPATTGPATGVADAAGADGQGASADAGGGQPWWRSGYASGQPYGGPQYGGWQPAEPRRRRESSGRGFGAPFFGLLLILFGGLALAQEFLPLTIGSHFLWPAFILGAGVLLVVVAIRRRPAEQGEQVEPLEQTQP